MIAYEEPFREDEEENEPEPLRMEHFYFPLALWFCGLLLSAIFLLAEIITHRRKKSQNEVLRQEEPSVTQSTPAGAKVEH